MLEIDNQVVSIIANDATISSLTGSNANDNRIYAWYPMTDISYIEGSTEVAIIYRNSLGGRPYTWSYPSQYPDFLYMFRILSINPLKLRQCAERLVPLFDMTSIQTTHWSVKLIKIGGIEDGMQEGGPTKPMMSKRVSFRFTNVFSRG